MKTFIAVVSLALLTACGGGGSEGKSDYWQGSLFQEQAGAINLKKVRTFPDMYDTEKDCMASDNKKYQDLTTLPRTVYGCTHVVVN